MVKVSIIILNWNGKKWLEKCLSSIFGQDFDEFEVLLVDNGSTDDSVQYVGQGFPQVKIFELNRNYGFAEGNNRAVKYANGEYLVFVNTDTEAGVGWLRNLVKAANENLGYQILCSIQFPSQNRNRARILNAYGIPMPSPYESGSAITDSLFASGAAFLVRKRWLDKIGGLFDPYYCAYGEDLELSLRTILLGGEIGYVRESRIYHYVGGAGLPSSRASYLSTRNILLTYYKLLELKNFTRIFLVQMAYIVARLFARKQQVSNTINMMKGVISFFSSFPRYAGYRRVFASNKKRDDKYIFERFLYRGKMEKLILKRGIYRS